jgi:glycosyltransferase involved in cell wall biosynthesis
MRIVLVGPVYPYRGGIAQYTARLAQALGQRHSVEVVSFCEQYPAWLYPGTNDRDPSMAPLQVAAHFWLHPFYPWNWVRNARSIHALRPQVILMQWWTTFWGPAFGVTARLLRQAGSPLIFLVHNALPHEPRWGDRAMTRWVLDAATGLLAHSAREVQRLPNWTSRAPVAMCPLPAFDHFVDSPLDRADARRRLGLELDTPLILFFGFVRPYKGLEFLIESLARVNYADRRVNLVVAGEIWEDEARYRAQVTRLGLEHAVRFDNWYIVDEVVPLYFAAADVFAAPYLSGSQSAVLTTAASFGMPLVVTNTMPLESLNLQATVVYTSPSADVEALAQALRLALSHPGLAHRRSRPEANNESWLRVVETIERLAGAVSV